MTCLSFCYRFPAIFPSLSVWFCILLHGNPQRPPQPCIIPFYLLPMLLNQIMRSFESTPNPSPSSNTIRVYCSMPRPPHANLKRSHEFGTRCYPTLNTPVAPQNSVDLPFRGPPQSPSPSGRGGGKTGQQVPLHQGEGFRVRAKQASTLSCTRTRRWRGANNSKVYARTCVRLLIR